MIIPESKVVRQYLVIFHPDEVALLKELSVLHPYYQLGDELWFTEEAVMDLKKFIRPEDVDKARCMRSRRSSRHDR